MTDPPLEAFLSVQRPLSMPYCLQLHTTAGSPDFSLLLLIACVHLILDHIVGRDESMAVICHHPHFCMEAFDKQVVKL